MTFTATTYNYRPIGAGRGELRLSARAFASAVDRSYPMSPSTSGLPRCRRVGVEPCGSDLLHTIPPSWVRNHCHGMHVQIWPIVRGTGPRRCRNVSLGLGLCCRFVTVLAAMCSLILTGRRRACSSLGSMPKLRCGHLLMSTAILHLLSLLVGACCTHIMYSVYDI